MMYFSFHEKMEILRNGWGTESTNLMYSIFRKDTSLPVMHHKLKYYRDLHWMICSGPMLAGYPGLFTADQLKNFSAQETSWLREVMLDSSQLEHFMKPVENEILGRIYERLFLFWMSNSPNFRLIGHNIQIQINGKTATEVDFIAEHIPTSTTYHFEVSCKYYLGSQNSTVHDYWIGPNGSDNLGARLKRMDQQLSVFETKTGKELLNQLGVKNIKSSGWLKGYLFFPHDQLGRHRLPAGASGQVPGGWYMRARDIHALDGETGQWLSLPRNEWISPVEESPLFINSMNGRQLIQYVGDHFAQSHKALLLIQVNEQGHEISRGFIVGDHWPKPDR
ncbi:MAG: hypothetical protein RL220_1727 [Bacteroidota bacterium]